MLNTNELNTEKKIHMSQLFMKESLLHRQIFKNATCYHHKDNKSNGKNKQKIACGGIMYRNPICKYPKNYRIFLKKKT